MLSRWLCLFSAILGLWAQTVPVRKGSYEFDIKGGQQWVDTGVNLYPANSVRIAASGTLQYSLQKPTGPEGLPRGFKDLLRMLPLNGAGRGALIGRLGNGNASFPFLIGPSKDAKIATTGRLYLGINQPENDSADGSFHVKVELTSGGATSAKTKPSGAGVQVPSFTQDVLDRIPTRVADAEGNPGDRVNFLIIGSESNLRQAFESAGWVVVDRTKKDAVIHSIIASLSKQAYLELPMSELYLFGRAQDFGYAHAEPFAVAASRHHLRLWKAPFTAGGQPIWVGAATHDIGFERDQRNGKLTHKIDPAVDDERELVGDSLNSTGLVAKLTYMTSSNAVKEARTATGGSFHSDGRTMLLFLNPDDTDRSAAFSEVFCSVLRSENPDTGDWGDCSNYLDAPSKASASLATLSTKYRLLIVPGFFNACASSAPAFEEGQVHLREQHGMTVEMLPVPNDSCEANARQIAQYLREHMRSDTRKYIAVGYSKGAPDLQVALAQEPDAAASIAAFVTVAGAVGGSQIADLLPGKIDQWMRQLNLGKCQGDVPTAMRSLRRDVRKAFEGSHSNLVVPTYSFVAVSDRTNTSKMMLDNWLLLSPFGANDSQLTKEDAIVPGAQYLGSARADHLAVGLPFEKALGASARGLIDHGHYPRATLLESIARFVILDLEK